MRPKFDRLSTRRAVGRCVPFIVAIREHCGCGQALRKNDLLKRCEPMMVARRRSGRARNEVSALTVATPSQTDASPREAIQSGARRRPGQTAGEDCAVLRV